MNNKHRLSTINRRPACVYMELDQQCTDICSQAGFLWHPSSKSLGFQYLYLGLGFSPVLPLFNFSSSRSAIYAYPSYHRPGSISFTQSLYSTRYHFIFFTYHTSNILPFPSPLYLPTYLPLPYFPPPPPHPVTHSPHHPPDAVSHPLLLIPPTLRPAIYIGHGCSPFFGFEQ